MAVELGDGEFFFKDDFENQENREEADAGLEENGFWKLKIEAEAEEEDGGKEEEEGVDEEADADAVVRSRDFWNGGFF